MNLKNKILSTALLPLAIAGICVIAPSAKAERLSFNGGTYDLTASAAGFSITNVQNLTGKKVNDLHLDLKYINLADQSTTKSNSWSFGEVAAGGSYTPPTIGGGNVTQGFLATGVNLPNADDPKYDGSTTYWTFNGDPVRVPGPLPLLGVAAAFAYSRKIRGRIKSSEALQ